MLLLLLLLQAAALHEQGRSERLLLSLGCRCCGRQRRHRSGQSWGGSGLLDAAGAELTSPNHLQPGALLLSECSVYTQTNPGRKEYEKG